MTVSHLDQVVRLASPRHRRPRLDTVESLDWLLRLGAVALLSSVGWIHLHLWQDGYRHIPTIGPLFLLAAVTTFAGAAVLLIWPSRLLGLLGLATDVGIAASLALSINVGLFGFQESLGAPFVGESFVIELMAAVALMSWVAFDFAAENRHTPPARTVATGAEYGPEQLVETAGR